MRTLTEERTLDELTRRFPDLDEAAKLRAAAHVSRGAPIEEAVAIEAVLRGMQGVYNP
ncbi:MAG: hypothetical protein ACREPA_09835 [Candidatus Dormibacteraceae bacterium]